MKVHRSVLLIAAVVIGAAAAAMAHLPAAPAFDFPTAPFAGA